MLPQRSPAQLRNPAPRISLTYSTAVAQYQRILLKISGEVLAGQNSFGIDAAKVGSLADEIAEIAAAHVQIGLVVGGGNFFRGVAAAAQSMGQANRQSSAGG